VYKGIDWEAPYDYRGSIRPPRFEPNKHEWVAAEGVVTEGKQPTPEEDRLFDGFGA
jgi:hypothetical protein